MRAGEYINATQESVEGREFNIFFGFSIGNKYFTPDHIRTYLEWALVHTKDQVVVLIPDKIHAVNYEIKNGYSPERAMSVAMRKGMDREEEVGAIIHDLGIADSKIQVVHWQEIEDDQYKENLEVIQSAFTHDPAFRETVLTMTREAPQLHGYAFSDTEYERLAQYIICEMPVLVAGLTVGDTHFGLLPYPGLANLDYLARDLQEGEKFPEITAQLKIDKRLAIIELYAD